MEAFFSPRKMFSPTTFESMDIDSDPIIDCQSSQGSEPFLCDLVFSFDTTGSMRSVISSLRKNLSETVDKLFKEIDGIRIGIIAHGDYCDYPKMLWKLDLTKDQEQVKNFILESKDTGGGDAPECYEFALHVATKMSWKADVKILVIMGDESPHDKGYIMNKKIPGFDKILHIDWKEEVKKLKEEKVTIFSCHAQADRNRHAIKFYNEISKETNGMYFVLDELQAFQFYMMSICLKAADEADVLKMIRERQEELEKQLQGLTLDEDKKKEVMFDLGKMTSALKSVESGEMFTSPEFNEAKKSIKKIYKTPSRSTAYINNSIDVNRTTISSCTLDMMTRLKDEDDEEPMKIDEKRSYEEGEQKDKKRSYEEEEEIKAPEKINKKKWILDKPTKNPVFEDEE